MNGHHSVHPHPAPDCRLCNPRLARRLGPPSPAVEMTPDVKIATLRTALKAMLEGHTWAREAAEHALEISGGV